MFTNRDLHHYCRCNNTEWVNRILDTSKDINVLYEYGTFFRFATKNNNVEICSALLTYFEEKQFSDKAEAMKYEKWLKSEAGRDFIKNL